MKVLFILKKRLKYCGEYSQEFPSGLFNSAKFVSDMLNDNGIKSKVVEVIDNNDIDRVVHKHRPDVVIIEALWVVPEKFEVLKKFHPNVKWIVRIHSETPFLAQEGIAVEWIKRYVQIPNVYVATNSLRGLDDLRILSGSEQNLYLPNFYPLLCKLRGRKSGILNIACFGAVRPFKNHLTQAVAAIRYGKLTGKKVRFHINGTRCEQKGDSVLKNLRALFAGTENDLIEHEWMEHKDFLKLLSSVDLSMSVSFSETFCIVAADAVASGIPIVVSPQVPWSIATSQADPNDSKDIFEHIITALSWKRLILILGNQISLYKFSSQSRSIWLKELKRLHGK